MYALLRIGNQSPCLAAGISKRSSFGRWFIAKPKLYLFDEPTQGVDVATKLELYRVVRQLADEGAAVLLLTSDLLELIGLCDRIIVIARGRVVDRVPAVEATEERIVGSAFRSVSHGESVTAPHRLAPPALIVRTGRRSSPFLLIMRRYGGAAFLLVLILLLGSYTATQSRWFLTERNLGNLLLQIAPLALVGCGQTPVILAGGIDLSVGPLMSLTTAVASYTLVSNSLSGIASGVALCLTIGLLVGALNGFIILRLDIPDLISTLSTFSIVTGLALTVRPSPGGTVSETFMDAVTSRIGWVPIIGGLAILLGIAGEIFLLRGRISTRLYAIGSNKDTASRRNSRGPCPLLAIHVFWLMAAVAGLVIAARIRQRRSTVWQSIHSRFDNRSDSWRNEHLWRRGTMIGTLWVRFSLCLCKTL